ncbi:glycine betaine/L-proline ABC transporter ATP-binding protein [Egibacter rhizosphaerae]|uniref:Glycine betaine/L-proline ABC transporter ATP-binding protein n=1 Tax=Egibacter rhizosphaerae TaxID=1670831 RepID=A0A411YG33_9ACTN|nr:glycine betaine/L-proline ABC transporter ATP-binding protein [Egibacter rhizosphaerae]QBI20190.1 glycine betaine/L-proline ABC transporter ATP-binding protein [Egibacter rhizosphaerae]
MSAIRANGLFKVFGSHPERAVEPLQAGEDRDEVYERTGQFAAVVDATFTVEPGQLFVVMGLSGSGKSTLVRMVNRLLDATAGTCEIDGTDIASLNDHDLRDLRSRRISMVFQSFALFPHRTVLENVGYGLEVRRIDREERDRRANEALEMVGLEGWGERKPHQLSGGMRQRVGLARALATDADIMLMDEPFSALDPLIRRDIQGQLLELQSTLQKTIIFITHDLNEAMRLGDRIAVMKAGAIVQNDEPEKILNNPANDYVADFIQDVDRSRILTAGTVAVDPIETLSPRHGPKVGMLQLRERQAQGLYVVDHGRKLVGAVRDQDLAEAANRGDATLEGVVHTEYEVVSPDTALSDVLEIAANQELPVAVVDDAGELVGVLPRALLLSSLTTPAEHQTNSGEGTAPSGAVEPEGAPSAQ